MTERPLLLLIIGILLVAIGGVGVGAAVVARGLEHLSDDDDEMGVS